MGGQPRYEINNEKNFTMDMQNNMARVREQCMNIVNKDYLKFKRYKK